MRTTLSTQRSFALPTAISAALFVAVAALSSACSKPPASPFDTMKGSQVTVFRLQNYEPPAAAAATLPGAAVLPQQIQQWLGAGASMLPPGLIPPGLLPGTQAAPAVDAQRFNGFRILAATSTLTESDKSELADILGHDSSFDDSFAPCMYPEFGIREERVGAPPVDVLISFSCDQVQPVNFAWPHKNKGLTSKSTERLSKLMRKVWGG
jgi:hypothetical protein